MPVSPTSNEVPNLKADLRLDGPTAPSVALKLPAGTRLVLTEIMSAALAAAGGGTSRDHRAVSSSSARGRSLLVHQGPRIAVKQTGEKDSEAASQANGSGRFQICSFRRRSRRHCRICQWPQLDGLKGKSQAGPRGTLRCGAVSRALLVNSECAFKSPLA
jgi:hypothetical protein